MCVGQRMVNPSQGVENPITIRNGEQRHIIWYGRPLVSDTGEGPSGLLAIGYDITERRAAEAELERQAAELTLLSDVEREIARELDYDALQQRTAELIQTTFGYDHVVILAVDRDRGLAHMVARAGELAALFPSEHTQKLSEGLVGLVCRQGQSVLVNDVAKDSRYMNAYPGRVPTQSELCVPIWVGGEVVAAMDIQDARKNAFRAKDLAILEALADQLAVALTNARLYAALQEELGERLRAEAALRESQERLNLALEGGDLGLWTYDLSTRSSYCSAQWTARFGFGSDEPSPDHAGWLAPIHPDDRARAAADVGECLRGEGSEQMSSEYRLRTQDGVWRWVLVRGGVATRDRAGSPLQLSGTLMDITARKRAEIALRDLNVTLEAQVAARTAELQAERDKSAAILETTADAIALVDRELRVSYVNPAFETLTGYTSAEALGRRIRDLIVPPDVSGDIVDGMRRTMRTEEPFTGELQFKRNDGRTYDVLLQIAPVRAPDGIVSGYLTSHRDISGIKRLQRMQTRFISNVSHELRTPIAVLKLYTDMLPAAPIEKRADYERALQVETEHLTNLVEDILRINSLSADGLQVDRRPLGLNDLVRSVADELHQPSARKDGPEVVLDLSEKELFVQGNPVWLSEAIRHLTDNASRATAPDGTITLYTATHLDADKTWATVTVSDTGTDISEAEQGLIFDRFYRGQPFGDGQIPGAGLGLSIVKAIVELHGGSTSFWSRPGTGSAFTFWLPLSEGSPESPRLKE